MTQNFDERTAQTDLPGQVNEPVTDADGRTDAERAGERDETAPEGNAPDEIEQPSDEERVATPASKATDGLENYGHPDNRPELQQNQDAGSVANATPHGDAPAPGAPSMPRATPMPPGS